MRTPIWTIVMILACGSPLVGQTDQARVADCHGLYTAMLETGIPRGDFQRCRSVLEPDVVRAVGRMRTRADTAFLTTVIWSASGYRTPAVFDAALAVATDPDATHPARMGALAIALSQYRRNLLPTGDYEGWGDFLSRPVNFTCNWQASFQPHAFDRGLAPRYIERMRDATKALAANDADPVLSAFSLCVQRYLDVISPRQVAATSITVRYKCGNQFVFSNAADVEVEVGYRVGSDPPLTIEIPASGEIVVPALSDGSVTVYLRGTVVAVVDNPGTPCP